MPLDLARIKKRQAEEAAKMGSRWKPKEGKNNLRYFKFFHTVTEEDVKAGLFTKDKIGQRLDELDRPLVIHFGVGKNNRPVLSNQKLVEKYDGLKASDAETDQTLAEKIKPQFKYAMNFVDMDERPFKMRQWLAPRGVNSDIWAKVYDDDYTEAIFGVSGRDIKLTFDPKAKDKKKMYTVEVRDKDKCLPIPEEVAKQVIDFYSPKGFATLGLLNETEAAAPAGAEAEVDDATTEEDED